MLFCRLLIYFKIKFFKKFFQEYHQSVKQLIQIRPDILSGLIWIQTVCKGYQQMTLVGKELIPFFIAVAIIIIAWLLFCRRKPVEKEPFEDDPDDDIRENIMYYDEEGAGETIFPRCLLQCLIRQ